jgi:peroxiredoxin
MNLSRLVRMSATQCLTGLIALALLLSTAVGRAEAPEVGAKAPDFTLSTTEGTSVSLSSLTARGPVVLVVLRGYPGYQCPFCQKQTHDFASNAERFAAAGAQILLVYPGQAANLSQHAGEFTAGEPKMPANMRLVIDPDFRFTNLYGLRWDAPQETAYPSTFLIDRSGRIFFRKISHEHGDRTTASEILTELAKAK